MADYSSCLEVSVEEMRNYYPTFSLSFTGTGAGRQAVWTGKVQPLRTADRLEDLLDDIHCERPFYILPGGEVLHHPACDAPHARHSWTEKLTNPHVVYELEVRYGGGKRHPRAQVKDPPLPEKGVPHTFGDGAICPYAPWRQLWLREEHTVVDFMAHVLGWLIKRTVWEQSEIWIGPEVSHDARFLLRDIGPNRQCWCGSGEKYKKCHRRSDEADVRARK